VHARVGQHIHDWNDNGYVPATDTHENMSTASFAVHLKSAAQQRADLLTAVTGVGPGTTSLTR
jgi:hypothetical protein